MKGNEETVWKILEGHAGDGAQAHSAAVMAEPGPGCRARPPGASAPPLPWAAGRMPSRASRHRQQLATGFLTRGSTVTGKAVRTHAELQMFSEKDDCVSMTTALAACSGLRVHSSLLMRLHPEFRGMSGCTPSSGDERLHPEFRG